MQQSFKFTHFLHSLIPQMVCQQLYFNKHIIRPTMNLLGYIAYIVNFFLSEMMVDILILVGGKKIRNRNQE